VLLRLSVKPCSNSSSGRTAAHDVLNKLSDTVAELAGGKCPEFGNVDFVGTARFGVGDVREPFKLRRHVGEIAVLRHCQGFPQKATWGNT